MCGSGPIGSNGACSTLCQFSVTSSTTHIQIGPFWCCFPSGWVCVHCRPLWVSPRSSPVRLGVFPAAASTPKVFSIRGLRLYFPVLKPWIAQSVTWSTSCCLVDQLQLCPPCFTVCHLSRSTSCHLATSPLHLAACLHPSYRSG